MQSCDVVARLRVACLNVWYFSKELLLELSDCSMYPILYRMPSLAKPETLEAPLCFFNEHTGQQWLSHITETADVWPGMAGAIP